LYDTGVVYGRADSRSAICDAGISLWIFRSDVVSARPDQPVVRVLLEHVRGPPRHAADREDRREEIDRNAEHVVGGRGIEVHVRIQLLLTLHERFDPLRHRKPLRLAGALAEVLRHLPEVRGARILSVVDTVAEAGNLLLARELCANRLF